MRKLTFFALFLISHGLFPQEYTISLGDQVLEMENDSQIIEFSTINPLINNFYINMDYKLITQSRDIARVDKFALYLNYGYDFIENITVTPSLGFQITGNLDRAALDNSSEIESNLYTSLDFNRGSSLYISPRFKLRLEYSVQSDLFFVNQNNISASIGSGIILKGHNFKSKLNYSYTYQYNIDKNSAFNYLRELEDEGKINLEITAGDFRYSLDLFPNGEFARANYAIFFGKLPTNRTMRKIDLRVVPGIELSPGSDRFGRSMLLTATPMDWALSRVETDLKFSYGAYSDEKYYSKILLGANFNLIENINPYWISPFLSFSGGVETRPITRDQIGIYEVETGVNILIPQLFIRDNIQYGINISYIYKGGLLSEVDLGNHLLNTSMVIAIEL